MLVHLGLAPKPPGWEDGRYDNVARMNGMYNAQGANGLGMLQVTGPQQNSLQGYSGQAPSLSTSPGYSPVAAQQELSNGPGYSPVAGQQGGFGRAGGLFGRRDVPQQLQPQGAAPVGVVGGAGNGDATAMAGVAALVGVAGLIAAVARSNAPTNQSGAPPAESSNSPNNAGPSQNPTSWLGGLRLPALPGTSTPAPLYNKADEVEFGVEYHDERRNGIAYERELRYDLATCYYWSGDFCKDFVFFCANWHPLFGISCSHPMHPWSKTDRSLGFMVSSALTLLPAAALMQYLEQVHTPAMGEKMLIFLFVTNPVMTVEFGLYRLAMADIYLNKGDSFCGVLCKPFVALILVLKQFCFLSAVLVTAVIVSLSLMVLNGIPPEKLVHPFIMSRVQSWALWFPIWFLMPCMGFYPYWHMEKQAAEQAPRASDSENAPILSR